MDFVFLQVFGEILPVFVALQLFWVQLLDLFQTSGEVIVQSVLGLLQFPLF